MSEEPSLLVLILSIVFLLLLSAFFSGSETGMMASNKIKLRNKAKSGQKNSKRALELLAKPDNLLSVILVGNNFANILASALVTILMINFFESRVFKFVNCSYGCLNLRQLRHDLFKKIININNITWTYCSCC